MRRTLKKWTQLRIGLRRKIGHCPHYAYHPAARPYSGWDNLNALEKTLDSPVYLLNASLKQRFDLQVTPSFVQAKGLAFEIEEIPAKELVEKAQ